MDVDIPVNIPISKLRQWTDRSSVLSHYRSTKDAELDLTDPGT